RFFRFAAGCASLGTRVFSLVQPGTQAQRTRLAHARRRASWSDGNCLAHTPSRVGPSLCGTSRTLCERATLRGDAAARSVDQPTTTALGIVVGSSTLNSEKSCPKPVDTFRLLRIANTCGACPRRT